MEVKKKFEKPQMEVIKLKPAGMVCSSDCRSDCPTHCDGHCDDSCGPWDGDW